MCEKKSLIDEVMTIITVVVFDSCTQSLNTIGEFTKPSNSRTTFKTGCGTSHFILMK